mmetsp:Transcript_13335/g.36592  ORF Transcript_13335/g.36592 Transcript_13335/m.36592 type:complete len:84 (+) Transcript_13335:40-291(+)
MDALYKPPEEHVGFRRKLPIKGRTDTHPATQSYTLPPKCAAEGAAMTRDSQTPSTKAPPRPMVALADVCLTLPYCRKLGRLEG